MLVSHRLTSTRVGGFATRIPSVAGDNGTRVVMVAVNSTVSYVTFVHFLHGVIGAFPPTIRPYNRRGATDVTGIRAEKRQAMVGVYVRTSRVKTRTVSDLALFGHAIRATYLKEGILVKREGMSGDVRLTIADLAIPRYKTLKLCIEIIEIIDFFIIDVQCRRET